MIGLQRHGNALYSYHPSGKLCSAAMQGDITRMKEILLKGISLNKVNKSGENCLQFYVKHCKAEDFKPEVALILFASGEIIDGNVENLPDCIKTAFDKFNLKALCFNAIRNHLLRLDKNRNLFERVSLLPLPGLLKNELLMNVSLSRDVNQEAVESQV